jgi:5-methylcytosine-specific restriction endonuclease McrA
MNEVILLNSDYTPLGFIGWKKALKLIVKKKVEIIKSSTKIIHNFENTISMLIPEVIRLIKIIRNLWKRKVPFSKRNVLIRDNFICQYCKKPIKNEKPSIDHIIPKSKGGKSTFENTVVCCLPCNLKKDNKTCSEAKMFPISRPVQPTINQFITMQIKNTGLEVTLKELGIL